MQNPVPALTRHIQSLQARIEQLQRMVDENARVIAEAQHETTTPPPATAPNPDESILFQPFSSRPEASFFRELGERKLSKYMLTENKVDIQGWFQPDHLGVRPRAWLELRDESFQPHVVRGFQGQFRARGVLINVNTLERFKAVDKAALLREACLELEQDMMTLSTQQDMACLSRFLVLTYADLKAHKYLYWFAFASLPFVAHVGATRDAHPPPPPALIRDAWTFLDEHPETGGYCCVLKNKGVCTLAECHRLGSQVTPSDVVCLVCVDPGTSTIPGWTVRNLIAFASAAMKWSAGTRLPVLALRSAEDYVFWNMGIPVLAKVVPDAKSTHTGGVWEKSEANRMAPRLIDLSATLDPAKLSETASDLNVRLMKWRALPQLQDGMLKATRVLLLGAGTLGCAVSRCLLGWGFRHITLVDQGHVSYSNPSRQSLFVVSDCVNGGKLKAVRAAEVLTEIHPGVTARGVNLSIPMPGHVHGGGEDAIRAYHELDALVATHDVVCLLTDTRESRWLPTVLGRAHNKVVLNAALGFDSYLVMRHGGDAQLGCYFCSDVVAPVDSTRDRSLDQQCTVTRPGCAPIASALLVELMVGLLHHPKRQCAPLSVPDGDARDGDGRVAKLGVLPHQIRGHLPTFQNTCVSGPAFPQCTACSDKVLGELKARGEAFVLEALRDPVYLERLTGLDKLVEELSKGGEGGGGTC